MKQRIILFGLILVGTVTFAQSPEEKGLNTINRSSAEATIGFLASDEKATSSLLMLTAKSVRRKDDWKFIRIL